MPETEGLARKRKVRAAHRGSVTRIIGQVAENLESPDGPNLSRLRQHKISLSEKMEVLSKLDNELIEIVEEEELDNEVEQADMIRERMRLCIMDIDRTLQAEDSVLTVAGGRATPPMGATSGATPPTGTPSSSTATTIVSAISSAETATDPATAAVMTVSGGTSVMPIFSTGIMTHPTTAAVTMGLGGTSVTPTVVFTPPAGSIPPEVGASPIGRRSVDLPPAIPQVKLPELTIKKFGGDLTKWVSFWDSFESSIHRNPLLSNIDKFNYLKSFLESTAAESIAGLTLTSATYDEAVATLRRRFGNTQSIVDKHMDALLNLYAVPTHHDLKGLRRLYDAVEAHVRGLRALGVSSGSYGGLLSSILMNKLPPEIRLIISREMTEERGNIEKLMRVLDREVGARERSAASSSPNVTSKRASPRTPPTAATLVAGNSVPPHCVYCDQEHQTTSCTTVTDVTARKEILRKSGRCYVCLRRHHISRDCRSSGNCGKCRGRHHITICQRTNPRTSVGPSAAPPGSTPGGPVGASGSSQGLTNTLYVGARTPVLLQTAKLQIYNLDDATSSPTSIVVRAIMDSGSQRTYVTSRVKEMLRLSPKKTESLRIKTFGFSEERDTLCEAVELALVTKDDGTLKLTALVVPFICDPVNCQPISHSRDCYDHLVGLELADSADLEDSLEIDVLIGCDFYWTLVTGRIRRGRSGPTAIQTKVGWVLSGPADQQDTSVNLTLTSTHTLKINTYPVEPNLDDQLRRFWELESLGILQGEASVYEKFIQRISFNGQRYQVGLPWKDNHPPLPDNFELCYKRLTGLLRRLKQNPPLLAKYNAVIKDQLDRGIVEMVADPPSSECERVHYLPHHPVVRQDKTTSKLRIVYDASARGNGPSLNDCLYTGPSFGQSIFDILLRFRLHHVALAGDIEKAFLMVAVEKTDRDSLRFLWAHDIERDTPEMIVLRFTRVVFGVSSSPFLLNATINHHIETYRNIDPSFVDCFLSSIYVDDLSLGSSDVESTYELYLKSKSRLAEGGFKLRKFVTNSEELRGLITANEQPSEHQDATVSVGEEDQSYAKGSLGHICGEVKGRHKILGIQWDFLHDTFLFNIGEISCYMEHSEPTKRNVVSMAARFFDPLGVVSPVTILFKIFFQHLCKAGVTWDEPLMGDLLKEWTRLLSALGGPESLVIPRCYLSECLDPPSSFRLVGFCDASARAYAAVVYLRLESEDQVCVRFLAAKTRVSPLGGVTIPRLELLSALLLSKLMVSIQDALKSELRLSDPVCYTDSKVSLYWIRGCDQEWRQFVENRVISIRASVPARHWRHCPGEENPADIPSRGMGASELSKSHLWLRGPNWLCDCLDLPEELEVDTSTPEECCQEMKSKNVAHSLLAQQVDRPRIGQLMNCKDFSSLNKLLRVTALVLRFARFLQQKVGARRGGASTDTVSDVDRARLYWIRESQGQLPQDNKFQVWRHQFGLFIDESQVWRCGGRVSNSDLPASAQNPILLDKGHHLTTLIVLDAHRRVLHNGVRETLTELRSAYWIIRGRQFIRKLIYHCPVCRRQEGRPYQSVPPPALPEYRVRKSRPFCHTGVDFAGPLYVKQSTVSEKPKTWLCLYTCCVTRAVHLDLVPDLNAITFLRSFKRFTARRGVPAKVVSDNAKTFKSASRIIQSVFSDREVEKHFTNLCVEWVFNLERAPWWGGIFERIVQSAKRCLKKAVGKACLTYDELLTIVTEIEAVLNSRPLSYVSVDDLEEPLTPSHLLLGYRVLSLPDPSLHDDPDHNESAQDLSRRMKHLIKTSGRFWRRWRKEYLTELREFHRNPKTSKGVQDAVKEGQVVTIFDEGHPRGLWRLGRIEGVLKGADGKTRGAQVRTCSRAGRPTVVRRPIQHLYPLEVGGQGGSTIDFQLGTTPDTLCLQPSPDATTAMPRRQLCRVAAIEARDRILGCVTD